MKIAAWASALLASLVAADMAQAYPRVLFESEPNDRPEQAQSFRGEMRLVGEVRGQDVDMFWWALDDTESDRFWTLELTSMNHSALRAELTFGETQPAVSAFANPLHRMTKPTCRSRLAANSFTISG